jgi:hypothetical protein
MPWFLMLAVLVLVGPGVALACSVSEPAPWTKRTPDGRFEVALAITRKEAPRRDVRLSLRDRRSAAVLWTISIEDVVPAEDVLLTPDGSATLVIKRGREKFMLYGSHGESLGSWPLENVLSRSEFDRINVDRCVGKLWGQEPQVEGAGFSLVVRLRAPVGRLPDARDITFRISAQGRMEREPALLIKDPKDLIKMYRGEVSPLESLRLAEELWGASREERSKVPYELPRFWLEVLADSSTPRSVLPIAVDALGSVGTDSDLKALSRLPPGEPERDARILQVLQRRLPEEAGAYAIHVLEPPHPSPHVRAAALEHLIGARGTAEKLGRTFLQRDEVLRELRDLSALGSELGVLESFWQVLPFCEHPSPRSRALAMRTLSHLLHNAGLESSVLLDIPAMAVNTLRGGCPEVLIILGAVAQRNEDTALASRLYGFGVAGLEDLTPEQRQGSQEVFLEGKLRLAALAKAAKDWSELGRLTREVIADPARITPVCGPAFAPYPPEPVPAACARRRPAEAVARKLLQDARAEGVTNRELFPDSD